MTPEVPLQQDMFTGGLVDNRTRIQKHTDRQREKPKQDFLFSQRDMAQFGVNPRPLFSLSPHTTLVLLREDPRTEAEKEHDLQLEAEARNTRLFEEVTENEDVSPKDFINAVAGELTKTPDNTVALIVLAGLVIETDLADAPPQETSTVTTYRVRQTPQGHRLRQPIIRSHPPRHIHNHVAQMSRKKQSANILFDSEVVVEGMLQQATGCEAYGFSGEEQLDYTVSDERFHELLMDEATTLRRVAFKPQYFGSFLSVTLYREWCGQSQLVTFYGLGVHLQRKRLYHQTWFWDVQRSLPPEFQKALPKDDLLQLIHLRREAIAPSIAEYASIKQRELDDLLEDLRVDGDNVDIQHKVLQTLDDLQS